ncbi:MAG: hypothetical protein AB8G11_00880 [Saprospiraceae bacterium]
MRVILSFFIVAIVAFGCSDNTTTEENEQHTLPKETPQSSQMLPTLPQENIDALMNDADYIDLVFHAYGKSINFSEKTSVQNTIRQISNVQQPEINCATSFCKAIFYKMPEKLLEAEIHYGNGCAYYVFSDAEGKPQYANKVGASGITFFNDLITQFNASANQ